MLISDALKSSKNVVCSDTISRLCLFQAVLLLAQHYTMRLTTAITAQLCRSRKQTLFRATDMLIFDALKSIKNVMCSDTISRLCLFQAVLLLAQHYTMRLTTAITAQLCRSRKQTLFRATGMLIFDALTSSKNGVCSEPISRLCLFQAVLLLAQHYTMHLTTAITAQ
jgi:TRAP-type mannitol/chloroaromatic compound transport system permease small subunit